MAPPNPACSIDYKRRFSLPFAVPPTLSPNDLDTYLGDLDIDAAALYLARPGQDDLDPLPLKGQRIRALARPAGGTVLLPRTTVLPANLPTTTPSLSAPQIDAVAKTVFASASVLPGATQHVPVGRGC